MNTMPTHRKAAFARLLNRQRFANDELEILYGRYSCRLQQASVISCAVLLLIMGAILSGLQFWYTRGSPTVHGVYLLLQTAACAALLAFLIVRRSHDAHLLWLAYALLALCAALCVVSLPVPMASWAGTVRQQPTGLKAGPSATTTGSSFKSDSPGFIAGGKPPAAFASTDVNLITSAPSGKSKFYF